MECGIVATCAETTCVQRKGNKQAGLLTASRDTGKEPKKMRSGDTVLGSIWWDRLRTSPEGTAIITMGGYNGTHTQEFFFLDVAVLPHGKYRQSCLIGLVLPGGG